MRDSPFPVVDAHVHVVSADHAAYPLRPMPLSGEWYREAPCAAEDLLARMDAAGVARAVLVQPLGAYSYDNRYAADCAARHPERLAAVCCVDPRGEDPAGALAHWVGGCGMRGVRLFALARDGATRLDDPRLDPLWERAAGLGVPVVATIFFHQIGELDAALRRHPAVPVALDHCAFPPLAREPWPEAAPLLELSGHANLFLKVSTHAIDAAARGGDPARFVAALAERFGARRLLWGSDFAQTHDRPYARLAELGREAASALAPEERAWFLGGSAARLWPLPAGSDGVAAEGA